MKKIILFISIYLLCQELFGQNNIYFQDNPIWRDRSLCAVPLPCLQNETVIYFVNGDTIINTLTYKRIYKKGQGHFEWLAPPPIGCSGTYWFRDSVATYYLRSSGKQVYLREPNNPSEFLLYDFDLAIGDTLPVSFNNSSMDITVTGIDSIYTPYRYLR